MKWIWESRKMGKNRWNKVWLEWRVQRLQQASWWSLGNAASKLWPCPALESRKWMKKRKGGGAKRGIRWEEPSLMTWVLLWRARSSDISSRAAQETNLPRAGHKWTGEDLGGGRGSLKLWAITRLHQEKIQMQLDTKEIETGPEERDGGWGELLKRERIIKKERGGGKFNFFSPLTMINAFQRGEVWR